MTSPALGDADEDDVVVLVDARDLAVGVAPKLEAHRTGQLHRAVSVLLFDDAGRVLLQRRAAAKYHSAGLWSNTCCGHPRPGESVASAGGRRLRDELGIVGCPLTRVAAFQYRADLGNGLVEHEVDHVLIGHWNGPASPDPREVMDTRWVEPEVILADLALAPARYTTWVQDVVRHACAHVDRWGGTG